MSESKAKKEVSKVTMVTIEKQVCMWVGFDNEPKYLCIYNQSITKINSRARAGKYRYFKTALNSKGRTSNDSFLISESCSITDVLHVQLAWTITRGPGWLCRTPYSRTQLGNNHKTTETRAFLDADTDAFAGCFFVFAGSRVVGNQLTEWGSRGLLSCSRKAKHGKVIITF